MTIEDLFTKLGGPAAVARAMEKSTEHACAMRRRRSIPVRYWPKIIQFAAHKRIEITHALMTEMHMRKMG